MATEGWFKVFRIEICEGFLLLKRHQADLEDEGKEENTWRSGGIELSELFGEGFGCHCVDLRSAELRNSSGLEDA